MTWFTWHDRVCMGAINSVTITWNWAGVGQQLSQGVTGYNMHNPFMCLTALVLGVCCICEGWGYYVSCLFSRCRSTWDGGGLGQHYYQVEFLIQLYSCTTLGLIVTGTVPMVPMGTVMCTHMWPNPCVNGCEFLWVRVWVDCHAPVGLSALLPKCRA